MGELPTLMDQETTLKMFTRKGKAAAAVAVGALVFSALAGAPPSGADPQQFTALVGVGSDTTQEVMNAMAGFNQGIQYEPIISSNGLITASWDATNAGDPTPSCIITRTGFGAFQRPNGSTEGRIALSEAIDPAAVDSGGGLAAGYGTGAVNCGAGLYSSTVGQVDFARSSSGPKTCSGAACRLTQIPFGRDGLGYAYYGNGVTPVTTFTRAELQAIFTTSTPQLFDPDGAGGPLPPHEVIGCDIQTGSGTRSSWATAMGSTTAIIQAGTADCAIGGTQQFMQEHDADGFYAVASNAAFAGKQVLVAHSGSTWIAQANGVSLDRGATARANGVDLGSIINAAGTNLGKPYTGTGPLAPSSTFYTDTTFGRDLYTVVNRTAVGIPGNPAIKSLFVGTTSALCSETATLNSFGILDILTRPTNPCGSTAVESRLLQATDR